jgi:acetyl-CoA carboxylase carboxyl transferase subunit beta
MANGWFQRKLGAASKRSLDAKVEAIPEGLWSQCPECRELLFNRELERGLKVCKKCSHHFRLTAAERLALLLDPGSFREWDGGVRTIDPLEFPNYDASIARNQQKTGMTDAILSGEGRMDGIAMGIAVTDSHFIMGSMGSVVGERITRMIERSIEREMPVLLVSGSGGGARMQEGLLSLMQMAKTSAALARLKQAGLMSIVLLTDPTMGGVFASWASLGDVLIAEPGAMIGFAGQRVSQQTGVMKPPPNFQTAEFQLEHGMIDLVCPRKELRDTLIRLLQFGRKEAAGDRRQATVTASRETVGIEALPVADPAAHALLTND